MLCCCAEEAYGISIISNLDNNSKKEILMICNKTKWDIKTLMILILIYHIIEMRFFQKPCKTTKDVG